MRAIRYVLAAAFLLAALPAHATIALDATACPTAATCPFATSSTTATTPVTTGTFSTANAVTMLVAVGYFSATAVSTPVSITWHGSTPAGATTFTQRKSTPLSGTGFADNFSTTEIWTATTTSTLSTVSVDAATAAAAFSQVSVYVITCTSCTIGVSAGQTGGTPSAQMSTTLTGATAGDWIFFTLAHGNNVTPTAQSGSTFDHTSLLSPSGPNGSIGRNTVGAGGTVTVGSTASDSVEEISALEICNSTCGGVASVLRRTLMGVGQ